jgi:hypothetical protein
MAESKNNMVIQGFTGKLGDQLVFRQVAGKTIASKAPGARQGEPTEKQVAVRDRFQRAVLYGRSVLADPAAKQAYSDAAPNGQSAYNVAIADFFQAPDIMEIDVSSYTGQVGEIIKVKVTDDFKVKAVRLSIQNDDGSLLEEGNAVQLGNSADWTYTATATNSSLTGDKITVTATDNPANLTTDEKTL